MTQNTPIRSRRELREAQAQAQVQPQEIAEPDPPVTPPETPETSEPGPAPRRGRSRILLGAAALLLAVVAGVLIWLSWSQSQRIAEAPLPKHDVSIADSAPVRGPDGQAPITVAGTDQKMDAASMAPGTMLIPALGAYSDIVSETGFEPSRYAGFDTLELPTDPSKTGWFAGGAGLVGGDAGTTLLASHVSYDGVWGVLRDLYTLKGGELVYVKDDAGLMSTWKIIELKSLPHTQFPAEYWSAEGVRQLVITTCGGTSTNGHYSDNIFAIAIPA